MADKWTLVPCPCGHPKCTDVMIPGVVEQQGAREHGELIVKAVNSYEAFSLSQIEHDMLGCSMTKTGIYAQANERTKRDEPQCVYEARSRTGGNSAANGIQDAWCRTHGFDCPNAGPQKSLALRGEPVANGGTPRTDALKFDVVIDGKHDNDARISLEVVKATDCAKIEADLIALYAAPISGEPPGRKKTSLDEDFGEYVLRNLMLACTHWSSSRNADGTMNLVESELAAAFEARAREGIKELAAPISGERAEIYTKEDVEAMCAIAVAAHNRRAAVSGERVREVLDAARWQRFCELWAASTELSATQDESGFWIIRQIEAVENETFGALVGETPDDAIDKALPLAAQPEEK